MGLLSFTLWVPLLGAIALLFLPNSNGRLIKLVALAASGISLLASLWLAAAFDKSSAAMQFTETRTWVPEMGMTYALGVDGIALVMVLLTTIVTLFCLLAANDKMSSPKSSLRGSWCWRQQSSVSFVRWTGFCFSCSGNSRLYRCFFLLASGVVRVATLRA